MEENSSRIRLDDLESRLLDILIQDARRSISSIARELGVSRPTIRKKLRCLQRSGLIKGFTVKLNRDLLGFFEIVFVFRSSDPEKLASKLESIPEIAEVYVTTGVENVIAIARLAEASMLKKLLNLLSDIDTSFEMRMVKRVSRKEPEIDS